MSRPTFSLDGREIEFRPGDTIASAAFRAGVTIFSRSFKYHRPRGLYCVTGDCPNCLVGVDGEYGLTACTTPARPAMDVRRSAAERDPLVWLWRCRRVLPVGFYYKTLIRPARAWATVEPLVRNMTGLADAPAVTGRRDLTHRRVHVDVVVIGGGVAGLSAASAALEHGASVLLVEQYEFGAVIAPGEQRRGVHALAARVRAHPAAEVLERASAFGVYDGPVVAIATTAGMVSAHALRIVVATGAVEQHLAVEGNDLPGVWLGRGAELLANCYGLAPGRRIVIVGGTDRADELKRSLTAVGAEVVTVVERPETVAAIHGRRRVTHVHLAGGHSKRVRCDAVVAATGFVPRDRLLRMANEIDTVHAAGEVTEPGCTFAAAAHSGRRSLQIDALRRPTPATVEQRPREGCVCLCEDVFGHDLEQAWSEGFRSTELLKRYTTATMGPCQGAMCHPHLVAFTSGKRDDPQATAATTARPPVMPVPIETVSAAAVDLEHRGPLHERHLQAGATMERLGAWSRPWDYGDTAAEYEAVRERVSVMDVSTLGKYTVFGSDAEEFVGRVYPICTERIAPGKSRYTVMLNEAGYVFDDGLVCRLDDGDFYLTCTSAGAEATGAWLHQWADTWQLDVRIVDQSTSVAAIVVAGPLAPGLLGDLTGEDFSSEAFPSLAHRRITLHGVPCHVIRSSFVSDVAFELHHDATDSVRLWDALLLSGRPYDVRPHGLATQDLLRLERGHIIVGQDTELDSTPAKLGLASMIAMEKRFFIGRLALQRLATSGEPGRHLVTLTIADGVAPLSGTPMIHDGQLVGHITSAGVSPTLGHGIALGLADPQAATQFTSLRVGSLQATVVALPFHSLVTDNALQ